MKNSLRQGPDEFGYYGTGKKARGGRAVGETLVPVLQELSEAFEDAIKDQSFLDKFHFIKNFFIICMNRTTNNLIMTT